MNETVKIWVKALFIWFVISLQVGILIAAFKPPIEDLFGSDDDDDQPHDPDLVFDVEKLEDD